MAGKTGLYEHGRRCVYRLSFLPEKLERQIILVSCKFFLEKVAGIFGECCISVLEKVATPWSGRCHPMEADILC